MIRTVVVACLLISPALFAQQDVCIDSAWMSARSLIAQNDASLAKGVVETLKPGDVELYSLQWPMLAAETMWHTGEPGSWNAFAPRDYLDLVKRYEAHLAANGLLNGRGLVDWPETLRGGFDYENGAISENAVLNAYYYGALQGFGRLMEGIGRTPRPFEYRAGLIAEAFRAQLIDPASGLVKDAPSSTHVSVHSNAISAAFGLVPEGSREAVGDFLARAGLDTHPYLRPYLIEGLYRLGRFEEALSLSDAYASQEHSIDTQFLVRQYLLGLEPARTGWRSVRFAPRIAPSFPRPIVDEIVLPTQRLTIVYEPAVRVDLTVAPETTVTTINNTGLSIMVKNAISHTRNPLTDAQRDQLAAAGWAERVGEGRGVWVDVDTQMLRVIENHTVIFQAQCGTAANGVGSEEGSLKTPSGWHVVAKTYGENAPWGQVFKARQPTRQIWKPGDDVVEDMVLTRVLHLDGLELGHNKGGNVDSYNRAIYIHGTNGEALIGTPSSHGCVRMLNDDVIAFFPMAPEGTKVLITASGETRGEPAGETD